MKARLLELIHGPARPKILLDLDAVEMFGCAHRIVHDFDGPIAWNQATKVLPGQIGQIVFELDLVPEAGLGQEGQVN